MSPIHRTTICHPDSRGVGRLCFRLMLVIYLSTGTVWAGDGEIADPNAAMAQADLIVRMTAENEASKAEAILWAKAYGFPVRFDDGQRVCELMAVWKDRPAYYVTDNVNAATSTAADRIRDMVPWQLEGSGLVVGLWDESVARARNSWRPTASRESRLEMPAGVRHTPRTWRGPSAPRA